MRACRAARIVALAVVFAATGGGLPVCQEAPEPGPPAGKGAKAPSWESYASLYGYFVPEEPNYLVPIVYTDRGRLHLEARYNYEAADTGSIFAGWNFSAGEKVAFEATAMLAAILGDVRGVAPAYRVTVEYKRLEVYSEGEYVFDSEGSEGDFFYNWTEVAYRPVDWFRAGLVGQRTRLYETGLDIQRGFLIGFAYERVDFSTYVFNLDLDNPTVVLAAGISF